jgi:hypothetical protein
MNPVAIFFIVFFLALIGWATFGLEAAIAFPDVAKGITLLDIFLTSSVTALASSLAEVWWITWSKK